MEIDGKPHHGVISLERLPLPAAVGHPASAWLIRHALCDHDAAIFDHWGIPCPPEIRRSVPKRQAEYACGRLAARHALHELGCATLDVASGSNGQPLWPAGVAGSITHSQGHAAALAIRRTPLPQVGIDIERVAADQALEALLAMVIADSELPCLKAIEADCPLPLAATLVFSAKEAFFKATHALVGRYFDFKAMRLRGIDLGAGRLHLEVCEPLTRDLVPGVICPVSFGFLDAGTVLTLCLREGP